MKTINISEIESYVSECSAFICCASFESRCICISEKVSSKVKEAVVFKNSSIDIPETNLNLNKMRSFFGNESVHEIPFDAPECVADEMAKVIEMLATKKFDLLIDTTTFTHETLLILLRIIYLFRSSFKSILCVYTGAGEYTPGLTPESTWLSKGCKDVRNVIGFPGVLKPNLSTKLIILAGFELERATKLIELIEPDCLVLGNGIEALNDKISATMEYFRSKFIVWKEEYKNIDMVDFEFSCRDLEKTIETIKDIITQNPKANYILVPLNTKLSTISTAIVALENPQIQLCYAVPEIYNYENYSSPGENITIIELKDFSVFNN